MADRSDRFSDEGRAPGRELPPSEVASPAERQAEDVVDEPARPRVTERDVTDRHLRTQEREVAREEAMERDREAARAADEGSRGPRHEATPNEELAGESVGGATGVLAGAALGSIGGPVGSVIGAIAGAIGGWWLGKGVVDAANDYTPELDRRFETHYRRSPHRIEGRDYARVRPAYIIGHLAARNPEYRGKSFEEIEPELRRGWEARHRLPEVGHPGESRDEVESWPTVRHFALEAYMAHQIAGPGTIYSWESEGTPEG